jgi:hypothetical protein
MRRRAYGDETWRLALAGEVPALRRVAELLQGEAGEASYEAHRARAFALAVEGRAPRGLEELNEGWTEDWPFPSAYAADVARVRFLAGDYAGALDALHLALRAADRVDAEVARLAQECVRRDKRLLRRGLVVATAGGTPWQRLATAGGVLVAGL